MLERRWLLFTLYGILLASTVSEALKGARTKFKIATTSTTTTTEVPKDKENEKDSDNTEATTLSTDVNATTGHTLTGIPQIDYIWDPNLPRELNGYNLSEYPFYNSIPEEIDFKCDGLHDGFYASVPHKCQVYHHCLYGTRYDFLCANFTAFDQKTFICHFASEVDCANSKKYWHRNDALYKATTTTPPPTQSTTTTVRTTTTSTLPPPVEGSRPTRRRRPLRRRPAYDYYEEDYYDDEYEHPRGRGSYDRRDEYDYDDRKYMRRDRDRDREFRDRERDYREREVPRREAERSERPPRDERDPSIVSPRERFHTRNNRREPARPIRDPVDEETRPIRTREPDGVAEDRRGDDRRYDKIPIKDDYDEEVPTGPSGSPSSGADSLVKPAAPIASVYARPRTPPKIRRPVPLAEQDRFSYKATPVQPPIGEARKRPTETPFLDDEYYDDELEDVRPRRPMRPRRPYRERERTFYDSPRDMRERDRDRPFRSRYRDDDEEMRPRKYPERTRERYYERGRDRALDRGKDRAPERELRPTGRRPVDKEEEEDPLPTGREKDLAEDPEEPRKIVSKPQESSTTTTTTTTTTATPKTETPRPLSPQEPEKYYEDDEDYKVRSISPNSEKPSSSVKPDYKKPEEEYSDDYYDEPEDIPSSPPPRTAVRIVKRPFLPSRGGNPNPRGLSSVGLKAQDATKEYEKTSDDTRTSAIENKRNYDAYKVAQPDDSQKRREFERQVIRRPVDTSRVEDNTQVINPGSSGIQRRPDEDESERKPDIPWNAEELPRGHIENSNIHGLSHSTESTRNNLSGPSGPAGRPRINEVPHSLQDIPESEYDVTLNEALTPSFNQESSLPSGFVLPLHRQLNREPVIQSSENNYKISKPYNIQPNQKQFVPSPQFVPFTRITNSNERSGSVQYFRTPEVINSGNQYRQSARSTWQDYTGY